jgi:hypothetical protein
LRGEGGQEVEMPMPIDPGLVSGPVIVVKMPRKVGAEDAVQDLRFLNFSGSKRISLAMIHLYLNHSP